MVDLNGKTFDELAATPILPSDEGVAPAFNTVIAEVAGLSPAVTERVVYVSTAGNDTNTGVTPGAAKLTLSAAVAALGGNPGRIQLGVGTFTASSNVAVSDYVTIAGHGPQLSKIALTGAALTATQAEKFLLRDLSISRSGSAGPCIKIAAGGSNGTRRFILDNVHITSSTGAGIHAEDSWVMTLINPIIQGCQVGLEIVVGSLFSSSANVVTILGGEINSNVDGANIAGVAGFKMLGTAVEGNTGHGLTFTGTNRSVTINGYFEGNAGWDISHDAYPSGGYAFDISGSTFFHTSVSGARAVLITRGQRIAGRGCAFIGYPSIPVLINESPASSTSGWFENCHTDSSRVVEVTNSVNFGFVQETVNNTITSSAIDVRTEFPRFPVVIPLESANLLTLRMTYTNSNSGGNVYLGALVTDAANTTIQSLATVAAVVVTAMRTISWTVDVTAQRGTTIRVNFRRVGENALDTNASGTMSYYEGRAEVRNGYR